MNERTERLQARINAALRETPEESSQTSFSPYLDDSTPLVVAMMHATREHGLEAALDLFDRLREKEDPGKLRHALMRFLVDSPDAREAGLHAQSLAERAPHLAAPSNRKE